MTVQLLSFWNMTVDQAEELRYFLAKRPWLRGRFNWDDINARNWSAVDGDEWAYLGAFYDGYMAAKT